MILHKNMLWVLFESPPVMEKNGKLSLIIKYPPYLFLSLDGRISFQQDDINNNIFMEVSEVNE